MRPLVIWHVMNHIALAFLSHLVLVPSDPALVDA
jgi:hypothetical protein